MRKTIWILAAAGAVLMTASQAAAKADVELAGGPPAQGPGQGLDHGAACRIRTDDLPLTRRLLYQLS